MSEDAESPNECPAEVVECIQAGCELRAEVWMEDFDTRFPFCSRHGKVAAIEHGMMFAGFIHVYNSQ